MSNSQFAMTCVDATDPTGLTLRVEFIWRGDRFGHVLSVIEPSGQVHPVLESVEGTAADDWPPSPPLQSLSLEEIAPGRRAALLVGMAGRSHWSASVEAIPGRAALEFDLACKIGRPTGATADSRSRAAPKASESGPEIQLGSRYRGDETALAGIYPTTRILVVACEPLTVEARGGGVVSKKRHEIVVEPAPVLATMSISRWQYRVELTS